MKLLIFVLCLFLYLQFSFQIPLNIKNIFEVPKFKGTENAEENVLKNNIYTHDKNPICFLPVESGPCLALYRLYYFNKDTGKCEEFVYGGCKGNSNKFNTKEECEKQCFH